MSLEALEPSGLEVSGQLVQRVADQALVLVPAAEGALVGLHHGHTLRYVCGSGRLAAHVGTTVRVGSSLAGLAFRTGRVVRSDDMEADPRGDAEVISRLGVSSSVFVPLRRAGESLGVLVVSSAQKGAFSRRDVALLGKLADFLGVAVGLSKDMAATWGKLAGPGGTLSPDDGRLAAQRFVLGVMQPEQLPWIDARERIRAVLDDPAALAIVFQPVMDIVEERTVAVEALARFAPEPKRGPDQWFAEARAAGLGVELELAAVQKALSVLAQIPAGVAMTVNVGPEALASDRLSALVQSAGPARVVLELTEHALVGDYSALRSSLQGLRRAGARLAVDDTGAGISSLAHILKLAPDFIKLDRDIVAGVDVDPVRRALASALIGFGAETGASVVAEGAETTDELEALRRVGVRYVQGYCLGRPVPLDEVTWAATTARKTTPFTAGETSGPV